MNNQEILEGNKLCAEFMEAILNENYIDELTYLYTQNNVPTKFSSYNWSINHMQYHSSYDWFMSIWIKFRNLNWYGEEYCSAYSHRHRYFTFIISNKLINSSLEDSFKEMIEAIKWYNTTIKK